MALVHVPVISTLVVGLTVAFIGGMLASRLKLSPIVGYLLAGIAIGPYTPGFVADTEIAQGLSEIGIVLLMFGVGLHFSIRDLLEVKGIAVPGAVVQIIAATILGAWVATHWGWSLQSGILFGLCLSVASTVVLLRALEENNMLNTINGHIAVGWLIVEDLVTVVALVILPALVPASGAGEVQDVNIWGSFFRAAQKIILFMAVMLIAGKRVLPWMLNVVARTNSRELFTLAVFIIAVSVAFGAAYIFDISFALGAFFAGMTMRESKLSSRVVDKIMPFQDAFAVLFFVSVGMMFNPIILIEEPYKVLIVLAIILFGKSIAAVLIVLLCGYPVRTAFLVSASLAQIGEFSFILGKLGLTYGVVSESANNLIMAGALVSIALNPFAFHAVRKVYNWGASFPRISRWMLARDEVLDNLMEEAREKLKSFVIVVGYGQLGKYIQVKMRASNLDVVMVDSSRENVRIMRKQGIHAIRGNAIHYRTLEDAEIEKASMIVIAISDTTDARRIIEVAYDLNPDIKVVVQVSEEKDVKYFNNQNVDLIVVSLQETAKRMFEYLKTNSSKKKV